MLYELVLEQKCSTIKVFEAFFSLFCSEIRKAYMENAESIAVEVKNIQKPKNRP